MTGWCRLSSRSLLALLALSCSGSPSPTQSGTSTGGAASEGGGTSTSDTSGHGDLSAGGSLSSGGVTNAGGAQSNGGSSTTGGAIGTGGVVASGGAIVTGGAIGAGGTAGASTSFSCAGKVGAWLLTGGSTSQSTITDGSVCSKYAAAGGASVSCGNSQCNWDQYCADNGTCQTRGDNNPCATTDCRDCSSGYSANHACLGACTSLDAGSPPVPCKDNPNCNDCCSNPVNNKRLNAGGNCVQCISSSDCLCPSAKEVCINNLCAACTPDNSRCVFADCHDCCGKSADGFCTISSCTAKGQHCAYSQCEDCCTISIPATLNTCICG